MLFIHRKLTICGYSNRTLQAFHIKYARHVLDGTHYLLQMLNVEDLHRHFYAPAFVRRHRGPSVTNAGFHIGDRTRDPGNQIADERNRDDHRARRDQRDGHRVEKLSLREPTVLTHDTLV